MKIGIIGTGQMGRGIARLAAQSGVTAVLIGRSLESAVAGVAAIGAAVDKAAAAGKIDAAERERQLACLSASCLAEPFIEQATFIIETIVEDLNAKAAVLEAVAKRTGPDVTIATNTSSLSVTELGGMMGCAQRFLGMHFFNPPHVLPLVEVVRTPWTSERANHDALEVAAALKRTPIAVQNARGFVVNRLLFCLLAEACHTLEDGVASVDAIDKGMRLGLSHPMGPFALMDLIGLDTCLAIFESLHAAHGDRYRVPVVLRDLVAGRRLGRKTSAGFLDY